MPYALLLAALLFPVSALAADPWDRADYALAGVAVGALAYDWGQTRYLVKNPCANVTWSNCSDPYREHNPILGNNPSPGKVDRYFVAAIAGTLIVGNVLPGNYRKAWFGSIAVLELVVIARNRSIGIRAEF